MLHACVQRFDVTKNLKKIYKILETKQALSAYMHFGLVVKRDRLRLVWRVCTGISVVKLTVQSLLLNRVSILFSKI